MVKQTLGIVALLSLSSLLTLSLSSAQVESPIPAEPPIQVDAGSQQLPQGTHLKIRFLTALNAENAHSGDPFLAEVSQDVWQEKQLILPLGTIVRGRVQSANAPRFFSKGGFLRLSFDHLVLPTGEFRPLDLQVDATSAKMDAKKNGFYTDPGMGKKLNSSVDKGVSQFKSLHEKGLQAAEARGGGVQHLLTVPTTTVAGVVTGTAVTTVEATKAIFGKGETVSIQPGEEFILDLSQSAVLQAQ